MTAEREQDRRRRLQQTRLFATEPNDPLTRERLRSFIRELEHQLAGQLER